ncbi:MAG: alpha/beta hydrolase, partial [Gammaproteobacteria bacterium]
EQWPFKPFVTGSNPVRPIVFFCVLFLLSFFPQLSVSDNHLINIKSHNGLVLNANLKSNSQSDTIFILVHGTRGYKDMEIIKSLSQKIYDYGYSSLSINLSYDIDNRASEFLSCDRVHTHNEHTSIDEIVSWYRYLENQDYKNIYFIGHSRGAFNVIQAMAIINNNNIKAYLLAPVIDTYIGTKNYYDQEHNLPYETLINNKDEFIISDRYPSINFLFCENARVSSSTFRSYLDLSKNQTLYPFTFSIIDLLKDTNSMVTIFSGTDDEILLDSYKKLNQINQPNISHILIDGADHFFIDIYLDDVIDIIFD